MSAVAPLLAGITSRYGAAATLVLPARDGLKMAKVVTATMRALDSRHDARVRVMAHVVDLGFVARVLYRTHVDEAVNIDRNLSAAHPRGR